MVKFDIDHADIVTSHICNLHCKYCVDKFINTSNEIIKLCDIEKFLQMLRNYTHKNMTLSDLRKIMNDNPGESDCKDHARLW